MEKIIWDKTYSVNVVEIDQQHQQLLTMINELSNAVETNTDKDFLGKTVSELVTYAYTHFKTEEKYFEQFGYPDEEEHIKEHTIFVNKVSDFIDEWAEDKSFLSVEILEFINEWLKKHIKGTDKQYAQFFNENGLQ